MKGSKNRVLFLLLFSAFILAVFLAMQPIELLFFFKQVAILFPKGDIGVQQRDLLLILQGIMLLVVIPVFFFIFVFSWKYNVWNEGAKYDPDLVDNRTAEFFWWGIPTLIVIVIGTLTCIKTSDLDPFKPIASEKPTKTIQVVALQWKWLFIYPEEGVASVNFLQIPVDTPIRFEITADAPMNSFWIPRLGGQIYAMPGMKTVLHLIANEAGDYRGSSANLSGEGFAGMSFITRASSDEEFASWVAGARSEAQNLDYTELAKPSMNNPVTIYRPDGNLFEQIVMKYM